MFEVVVVLLNGVIKLEVGVRDVIMNDGLDYGGFYYYECYYKYYDWMFVVGMCGVGGIGVLVGGKLGGIEDDL